MIEVLKITQYMYDPQASLNFNYYSNSHTRGKKVNNHTFLHLYLQPLALDQQSLLAVHLFIAIKNLMDPITVIHPVFN